MNGKIKILQSVGTLGIGGNEIFVMNFFRNIDKEKFQMDFIIYDDSRMDFYDEIISAGSKVYICKSNIKNKYLNTLSQIIKARRVLIKNKYDIIHCHSCSFLGIFKGVIAGKLSKDIKIISHSHNPGISKNTWIDKITRKLFKSYLSNIVDLGFACSDIAGESKYTTNFMQSKRFKIAKNAIEVNKFLFKKDVRKEMRKKYKIDDELIIGNIGRLEKQKNQQFLLNVFMEIKKKECSAKLLIIGEGSLEENLKRYAIENGMDKDVIFVGKVSDSEKYYNMMDIFVLTSIYEGFPFVMVESQINGLPAVVSTAITKNVNILGNVKFVPLERTQEQWAEIILENKNRFDNVCNCKKICKEYDLNYQARELESYYLNLMKI